MMRSALRALANGLSDLWLDPGLREDILGGRPGASKRKKGKREELSKVLVAMRKAADKKD